MGQPFDQVLHMFSYRKEWCMLVFEIFVCLASVSTHTWYLINNNFFEVCNEHQECNLMFVSFVMQTMFMPNTRRAQNALIG